MSVLDAPRALAMLEKALRNQRSDGFAPRAFRVASMEIGAALSGPGALEHRDALEKARQDRLRRAATLLTTVIDLLDQDPNDPKPLAALDEEYLRTAYMDRADCYYQLGDYRTAIRLYDQAATRFAQNILAIESYVQIVNAYQAMKEPAQATAAAERAQWILKRIPDEQFGKGALALSRQYYEDFLKLGKGP